ncbi:MAG: dTDP-4-dehydrorhamnose reductase [Candidatus Brocadiales bacterium]
MKAAIIGANGQLGNDLVKVFQERETVPLTHDDIEIADPGRVDSVLRTIKPDVVINTAAFHRVEDCETEYAKAFEVNAIGAANVARIAEKLGVAIVYISTDFVFDGKKHEPYMEDDQPNPLNTYGLTKLAGEYYVRNLCSRHYVVRTSGLYGLAKCRAKGGNFIDTMLRLAREKPELRVVDDQFFVPTYTWDLAQKIKELVTRKNYGIYHITNSGQCSWYEFAAKIFELEGLHNVNLKRVSQEEFRSKVMRPDYSVLGSRGLKALGLEPLRAWEDALEDYMAQRHQQSVLQ